MKNTIINLECIDITVDFYGVCKHEGLVIFVKGLIPGEKADVKITKVKNKIAYGIINKITAPSKYRIKEICPVAYKCGGCDIQHIDYNYQLTLKKKLVENTFRNMKLEVIVNDPIQSDSYLAYRNKIQVPNADGKIGYYRNHSNDIVEFDNCAIASSQDNEILNTIKSYIDKYSISEFVRHIVIRRASNGVMICLVSNTFDIPHIDDIKNDIVEKYPFVKSFIINLNTKNTNVIYGDYEKCIYGDDYIVDKCGEYTFRMPLRSFYQVNSSQMIKMYDLVIKNGDLNKNDNVLDLFCGIGTISLYISKYVNKVLGVEIVDKSIEYANINKEFNKVKNVEFILSDANDISKYIDSYNVVVLDPPRKGIDSNLIDTIIKSDIKKVIYISCNQATLARDLSLLSSAFKIGTIQPIDMFPQTKHIESITVLERL